MTNQPGNPWPGGPPPQGPGSTPPWWGSQISQPGGHHPQQPQQPASAQPPYGANNPYGANDQYGPNGRYNGGPSGFDPTRALGEAPPTPVSINEFAPPPNRTPLLITLVALLTLVLVIGGGIYLRSRAEQVTPSPSPTSTVAAGPGQPFETSTGQRGRWEILEHTWTDEGLQLHVRVYADTAAISFSFLAFANQSTQVVDPTTSPQSPDIRTGTAKATQSVTGYVFFPMPHEDATIILASGTGRQMSALPVKA